MEKLWWLAPYVIIIPTGLIYGWHDGIKWVAIFYPLLPFAYYLRLHYQVKKRMKDDGNN